MKRLNIQHGKIINVANKWYVADFETTSAIYYNKNGYTKVWLYGLCDDDCNIIKIGDKTTAIIAMVGSTLNKV